MTDPLDRLLVTSDQVSREMLAEVLENRIAIDPGTGAVIPLQGWHMLTARQRILLFLLGTKAALLKGILGAEGAGPTAIAAATGVPKGTVGRILRELAAERLLAQMAGGAYYVPVYAAQQVKDVVLGEGNGR